MNAPLYKQMIKSNVKGFLSFGVGSALYVILMTSLYPFIADNAEQINDMLDIYPDALKQAFGLESFGTYSEFISVEYFGLFFPIILGVFSVMTGVQLIAKLVDRGSMAYLLSTKVTRSSVVITQIAVLVSGLIIIVFLTFIGGVIGGEWLIDDQYAIGTNVFFKINIVGLLLFFAVGGYSFLISALLNDEKLAFGLAGGLTFLFYGLDMAGKISTDLDWLRNITLFSLYEPSQIAIGEGDVYSSSLILLSIGVIMFILAVYVFKRRNLPL
ncbi:ABC transporter permease subunit [Cytobacillus sp. Hm23]